MKGGIHMSFNKDMEFLLSKFAHELRNPLTSCYSTVQFIEMKHPEVKDFKYWSNIGQDLDYMNALISELSSFSKSERLQVQSFSSKAMLEQVSLSFAASIADSKVEYTSKLSSNLPLMTGDELKLKEVFRNLLRNAYEASLPNQTIYLDADASQTELIVQIKDTGCGISEEHLSTIFDPFVTHKKEGTGLGLAICQHIIQAHSGNIQVQSVLGKGTTFTVTIPLQPVSCEEQSET